MKPIAVLLAGLLAFALPASPAGRPSTAQAPAAAPKLIVIIVVDQMRSQYFLDYRPLFTKGFDRLLKEGAWFRHGAYPYLNTVTCAGHSTIGTGSFPYRHGMILNAWYDREAGASDTCTEDASAPEVPIAAALEPLEGHSAARMLQPTMAERLRKARGGRSVALSLKARSAITVAGREADAIAWFDDRGAWMTSRAYGEPPAALAGFVAANPPSQDLDKVWKKSLPESAYQAPDDAREEHPVVGWGTSFPHPLRAPGGTADLGFYTRWQRSPYSDDYLGRMAAALVDGLALGRGDRVDFLSISFSALDMAGHAYGPRSHEVQDILVRLDATLEQLLDHLDDRLGRGRYVLGLSADHGVSEIPEQTADGGRLSAAALRGAIQKVLAAGLGPGDYVSASHYTDQYLTPAAAARLAADAGLRAATLAALRAVPGVEAAYYGPDLGTPAARTSPDPTRRAAALSYHPARSGDLIVAPRPNWITSTAAATHGTHHVYDQRVPVILYGAGITPGTYDDPATPADLAPTLASLAGIPLGDVDGQVLRPALRPPGHRTAAP